MQRDRLNLMANLGIAAIFLGMGILTLAFFMALPLFALSVGIALVGSVIACIAVVRMDLRRKRRRLEEIGEQLAARTRVLDEEELW